jgi:peptidoglycan LD-endopeptidase LytH
MMRPTRFVLSLPLLPSPCARAKFVHLLRAVVGVLLLLSVLALAVILSSHPPPGLPSAFGVGKPVVQETRQPSVPATPTPPVLGDLPSVRVVGPPVTSSPEPTVVPSPSPALPSPSALPTSPPTAEPATPTPVVLRYVFPVRGASVSYGPYHHDYPAADIFCPIGSEYLATTSGVVEFVNRVDRWEPATNVPADRGGIMMAFVGDDGVRYYGSHLSAIVEGIEPGVRVEAGQLLGYTGNSGNEIRRASCRERV